MTPGQPGGSKSSGQSVQVYGGVELSDEGVKTIAIQVSQDGEDEKTVYKDVTRLNLGRISGGDFPPQASVDAAKAVLSSVLRLRQQYRIPLERIYLIGGSGLKADHPKDLVDVIRNTTGLQLEFLDPAAEVQLSIAGTIPRISRIDGIAYDNRNMSMLFHIGGASTLAGYEMLKYAPSDSAAFDFVAMSVPHGVVSYTNEVTRLVGLNNTNLTPFIREVKASSARSFRQALIKEIESKPGLMHRKRVYLTGNLAWALATLMYPDNRDRFVTISYDAIMQFADKMGRSPKDLAYQNLSFIRERRLREEVDQELAEVRATFLPQQLIAGAEMLKAAAEELKWKDKHIVFARLGNLGCLSSHVRLEASK